MFFADVRPARPDQGGALASRPGLGEDRGNLPDREEGAFPVLRTGRRATADAAWHYARGRVEAAPLAAGPTSGAPLARGPLPARPASGPARVPRRQVADQRPARSAGRSGTPREN